MTLTETVDREEYRELNLLDRCDRCTAQAFVLAVKDFDNKPLELLFCGHHFKKFGHTLGQTGWKVQNDTHKIQ